MRRGQSKGLVRLNCKTKFRISLTASRPIAKRNFHNPLAPKKLKYFYVYC